MERKKSRSQVWCRLALAAAFGIVGCTKSAPPAPQPAAAEPAAAASASATPTDVVPPSVAPPAQTPDKDEFLRALGVDGEKGTPVSKVEQVSFRSALRGSDDPPADCDQPPDQTMTGKSVFKLLKQVAVEWDKIAFVSTKGNALHYSARIETNAGSIEIALRPELAPNHVRNFVALARAGYYDGLCFDRVVHDESTEGQASVRLDMVEAGCPLGTGDPITSHLGYWLKPEFVTADKATNEEGTVGACRGAQVDTASCKFYISLTKNPQLDGNFTIFGKVTSGLDAVRRIYAGPVMDEDREKLGSRRPKTPVLIKKVTITVSEGAKG